MDKITIKLDDGRTISFDNTHEGYNAMYSTLIGSVHVMYKEPKRGLECVDGNVLRVNFRGR